MPCTGYIPVNILLVDLYWNKLLKVLKEKKAIMKERLKKCT